MRFFLLVLVLATIVAANPVYADCAAPYGMSFLWPDAPCHDTGESPEEQKRDWAPYYHYKGSDWMEQKTRELELLLQSDHSEDQIQEDWIGSGDDYIPQNYYFWQYYKLFGSTPPPDQKELVFDALPQTRQTSCDEECKNKREQGLFGAWNCKMDEEYPGNYLCYLGPRDTTIVIPQNVDESSNWPESLAVSVWVNSTIKWINYDNTQHILVSKDGLFEPKAMPPKSAFSFFLDQPGTYEYYLESLPKSNGTITVAPHDPSYNEGEPIRRGTNNSHKTQIIFREDTDQWETVNKVSILDKNNVQIATNESKETRLEIGEKLTIECKPKHDLYSEQSSLVLREVDLQNRLIHFILRIETFPNLECSYGGSPNDVKLKPIQIPESSFHGTTCDKECKNRIESHPSEYVCKKIESLEENYLCAKESPRHISILLTSTDETGKTLIFRPSEITASLGINNTIRWHNTGYATTISNQEEVYGSQKIPFNDISFQVLDTLGKFVFYDESNPKVKATINVVPLDQHYKPGKPITTPTFFPDVRYQTFRDGLDSQNFLQNVSILDSNSALVTVDNTMDAQYAINKNQEQTRPVKMSVGDKMVSGCTYHYNYYSRIFYHTLDSINTENNTINFKETLEYFPENKCQEFFSDPEYAISTIDKQTLEFLTPFKQLKTRITANELENIDGQLFYVIGPYTLRPQSEDTISFEGVLFSYPYYPVPISPGGVQSVDISFEDGAKEHIGTVGPPNPFLKFTDHKDPSAGVRRNSDGTFNFLISVNLQSISPLKQFTSGITIDEIQCKESLILVTKYDGAPACVEKETKTKLIERGWAKPDIRASTK